MGRQCYQGSKIIPVRIPDELIDRVKRQVDASNERAFLEPYNLSSWIRKCIEEKLAHLERSKKPRKQVRQFKGVPPCQEEPLSQESLPQEHQHTTGGGVPGQPGKHGPQETATVGGS